MKTPEEDEAIIPLDFIQRRIFMIRGRKVMIADHLSELYQVPVKRLNEAVKRNRNRFPDDFIFQLTKGEFQNLRSQFATSSFSYGGQRYLPYAFTEQGVAMLSAVLRSDRAIAVNIAIMRAFVRLRQLLASNKELADKVLEMEQKYDERFKIVFEALRQLMGPPASEDDKKPFGSRSK
jgi:hypothetical protein